MEKVSQKFFLYSSITSALGTEVLQIGLFTLYYFKKAKEDFELTHAAQFPEGKLPQNMTDVGKRAMENFLWNPVVYGKCDENTANSKGPYGGWTQCSRSQAIRQAGARWPHYNKFFEIKEILEGFKPLGAVDSIHHIENVYLASEHLSTDGTGTGTVDDRNHNQSSSHSNQSNQSNQSGQSQIPFQDSNLWDEHVDKVTGKSYYFNRQTHVTTWIRPTELGIRPPELIGGSLWKELKDVNSGNLYYYNAATGDSTWKRPLEFEFQTFLSNNANEPPREL